MGGWGIDGWMGKRKRRRLMEDKWLYGAWMAG